MGLREVAFPSLPCYPGQSQGVLPGHSVGACGAGSSLHALAERQSAELQLW